MLLLIYLVLCPFARLPFSVIQFHSPLCDRRFSLYTMVKFPGTDRHPFGTDTTGQTIEVQLIWYSLCAAAVYGTVSSAIMLYHNKQFSWCTVIKFPEFTRSSIRNDSRTIEAELTVCSLCSCCFAWDSFICHYAPTSSSRCVQLSSFLGLTVIRFDTGTTD